MVAIGILIALQINNWNESSKSKNEENNYMISFYDENKSNLEKIKFLDEALNKFTNKQ